MVFAVLIVRSLIKPFIVDEFESAKAALERTVRADHRETQIVLFKTRSKLHIFIRIHFLSPQSLPLHSIQFTISPLRCPCLPPLSSKFNSILFSNHNFCFFQHFHDLLFFVFIGFPQSGLRRATSFPFVDKSLALGNFVNWDSWL